MVLFIFQLLALLAAPLAAASNPERKPLHPTRESAIANAYHIFNAVHSAGRQWGSSLNHNGFGFIPVIMPEGTLMYHGGKSDSPPEEPDWLAFEMEHAGAFSASRMSGPGQPRRGHRQKSATQQPLDQVPQESTTDDKSDRSQRRGYFQTYQTTRDIRLLYLDGMSAGKTSMGTLDSQDLVLRGTKTDLQDGFMDERNRAKSLCDLVTKWGWDGIMRMEIGFEVIYCNFTSGLRLDSAVRSYFSEDKIGDSRLESYMWSRAVAERYDGIGGDRIQMDFSSMVSGLFFPINISSTDPQRPDLIRLGAEEPHVLRALKQYVEDVCTSDRKFTVNWQAVVDMIVTRLSNRLASMVSPDLPLGYFINELEGMTLPYYEAPSLPGDVNLAEEPENKLADARNRCIKQYLKLAIISRNRWSTQDEMIYAAVDETMQRICHTLFHMRSLLLEAAPNSTYRIEIESDNKQLEEAVQGTREITRNLMEDLAWTTWRKPQLCADGEVLFVAMWPVGNDEDYYNPGCRSFEELTGENRNSYWRRYGRRPTPPADPEGNMEEL